MTLKGDSICAYCDLTIEPYEPLGSLSEKAAHPDSGVDRPNSASELVQGKRRAHNLQKGHTGLREMLEDNPL